MELLEATVVVVVDVDIVVVVVAVNVYVVVVNFVVVALFVVTDVAAINLPGYEVSIWLALGS